jgi:hypothetical protein
MSRKHDLTEINGRIHEFHADATILSGNLHLPLRQTIEPQAKSHLYHQGGYLSQHSDAFRVEGVLSFQRAYTQVAGNVGHKPGHGWATLTTTVIERLNVLEVLTVDRVVGQIITEHPLEGQVPHISFLGTRFENLRIAGHPVSLDLDLNILGGKPDGDLPYAAHQPVVDRVAKQYSRIRERQDLPAELRETYNRLSSTLGAREAVECSLVNHASGSYPGLSFGHLLKIPDFGTVELAKLTVTHDRYEPTKAKPDPNVPETTTLTLTMIDLKLGCAIEGNIPVGTGTSNGGTKPPGG